MASHSSLSSSNVSGEQVAVPATLRLQRAMEAHAALQTRTAQHVTVDSHLSPRSGLHEDPSTEAAGPDLVAISSTSIDDLASQLHKLWQREKNQQHEVRADNNGEGPSPSLNAALQKIGSREKDELLLHLLEQQATLRAQRSEVAALGEKIAAQLLHQQHKLRQKYREQIGKVEEQLHEALHFNPQVATLQAKVDELEEINREHEQKLRFAVQKLQRSRKREKELKMMNDPLWD